MEVVISVQNNIDTGKERERDTQLPHMKENFQRFDDQNFNCFNI